MSTADRSIPLRRPVIAGNWKMNLAPARAEAFCAAFAEHFAPRADRTVALFPSAVSLTAVVRALGARDGLLIGVQNIHSEPDGAFTGELSATMARDAGAQLVLVGHSERRHVFGESDETVGKKAAAALDAGLVPVVCIGETLAQREAGNLEAVLRRQLDAALDALPADAADRIVVAYEPVWAIGTGVNATPDDAAGAHRFVRELLAGRYRAAASDVPILYGGSVKPDNAAALLAADQVDGVLVGGASLDAAGFAAIAGAPWAGH
jgi:triosephosphate isomerase (TIM)